MTIEQKTTDYEILIRYNPDGKIGAHRVTLSQIVNGDDVLSSSVNPPEPIDLATLKNIVAELTDGDWYVPLEAPVEAP